MKEQRQTQYIVRSLTQQRVVILSVDDFVITWEEMKTVWHVLRVLEPLFGGMEVLTTTRSEIDINKEDDAVEGS
eukprot:861563-Amphidinium_carterae.2